METGFYIYLDGLGYYNREEDLFYDDCDFDGFVLQTRQEVNNCVVELELAAELYKLDILDEINVEYHD